MKNFNALFVTLWLSFVATNLIAQQVVILQPDSSDGIDASLGYHPSYLTMDNNYGNDNYLKAFCFNVGSDINKNRGLIRFNLSDQRISGFVSSAKLSLFATGYINNPLVGHTGNNSSTLKRVLESWDENSVTWNTSPLSTIQNMVVLPPSNFSDEDYLNIDVTALVNDMLVNSDSSFGFLLQLIDESPGNALSFYSSDCSDPNKRPMLELVIDPLSAKEAIPAEIIVFPNPVSEDLNLQLDDYETHKYEIYNMIGEPILTGYADSIINVSLLPNGIYSLHILSAENHVVRFIKQ